MNPETKEKIKGWFYKSEPDYFSSFTTLWIAFNAYYKDFYQRQGNVGSHTKDRDYIENIKSSDEHYQLFKSLMFDPKLSTQIKKLKDEVERQPLRNMRNGQVLKLPDQNENLAEPSKDFYPTLMEIVYTIRNNLFHGEKEIVSKRDKKLVTLAYKILHRFMEKLINNDFQLPEADGGR